MDPLENAVATALSAQSCQKIQKLPGSDRSDVWRMSMVGAPSPTVIVKSFNERGDPRFRSQGDTLKFASFVSETTGCQVLERNGVGAKVLAIEPNTGSVILEDLGALTKLSEILCGSNRADAIDGLSAFVVALAGLHSATCGIDWPLLRTANGGSAAHAPNPGFWISGGQEFIQLCRWAQIDVAASVRNDLAQLDAKLTNTGAYQAFTPTDCCPDNVFVSVSTVKFIDCENATTRHALLDLAYIISPFPSCEYAARVPPPDERLLIDLYRRSFSPSADFDDQLTFCVAAWMLYAAQNGLEIRRRRQAVGTRHAPATASGSPRGVHQSAQRGESLAGTECSNPHTSSALESAVLTYPAHAAFPAILGREHLRQMHGATEAG